MTVTNGGRRSARIGLTGAVVATGLIFGSAMACTRIPPRAGTRTGSGTVQRVGYPSALPPPPPGPKVAVEGGAAAGVAASADAATSAAGATQGDVPRSARRGGTPSGPVAGSCPICSRPCSSCGRWVSSPPSSTSARSKRR